MDTTVLPGPEGIAKLALVIEYDGSNYHGFQFQPAVPTVQGELEEAIFKTTRERIRVLAASRTDAGAHARGQVASFRTKSKLTPETMVRALNYYLPEDIVVKRAYKIDLEFNVQRNAVSREYHYYMLDSEEGSALWRKYAYVVPQRLDVRAMEQACTSLVGCHDFMGFTSDLGSQASSTVRTVYHASFYQDSPFIIFKIIGSSFLPHQIRHIVGSLVTVGKGKANTDYIKNILEAGKRGIIKNSAPANGLYLMQVKYNDYLENYS
ncbi:MAG: tRNA pseudouridine(38-40) synthase TruA [Dehalococcoidia bacterium]|nr:tRNA pseudouridine(38-40) synthase TruA [Dehalococcoidia bacterium]